MRVLHLGRDLAPRTNGGLSVALAGLLRAQILQHPDSTFAAWSFDAWRPKATSASEGLPSPAWAAEESGRVLRIQAPAQLEEARALCRAWRPDLLHVHHAMLWEEAGRLAEGRLPRVYHVHTLQAEQERLRGQTEPTLSSTAEAAALRESQAVIVPSRAAARALLLHVPEAEPRLHTIGLGVDRPAPPPPTGARPPTVLVAGRFSDIKGTDLLRDILPRVLQDLPAARVRLAGGCPENLRAQRRWLKRLEESLGADRERMDFLGWLGPQALADEYRRARLLLCPSRFETFGQSVAEAMAHGLPVVASRAGGLPELVSDGEHGRLCDAEDSQGLAEACLALLRLPEQAARLGSAASARAQAWRWEAVAVQVQHLYDAVQKGGLREP